LLYGIVFTIVGVAGFIPGLVTPHDAIEHPLTIDQTPAIYSACFR
jgi:hypothetical protein